MRRLAISLLLCISSVAHAEIAYPRLAGEISESLRAERYFDAYFLSYWGELEIPEKGGVFRLARAVSSWRLGDPDQALHLLADLPGDQSYFYQFWIRRQMKGNEIPARASADLRARIDAYDKTVSSYRDPGEYSPGLSGALSAVIPGAGHAYAGLWQDAALTFALNLIGIAATVEFARHDLPFAAVAAGGVTSVFYLGGIISAVQSTRKINLRLRTPYLNQAERKFFPELEIHF